MKKRCLKEISAQTMQSIGSLSLQVHKLYAYYYTACCFQAMDDCVFKQLLWDTGGWNQEKKKLRKATVVPNEYANAQSFGEGRVCASSLCSNCLQSAQCSLQECLSASITLFRYCNTDRHI